jgi:hypothetical protein
MCAFEDRRGNRLRLQRIRFNNNICLPLIKRPFRGHRSAAVWCTHTHEPCTLHVIIVYHLCGGDGGRDAV